MAKTIYMGTTKIAATKTALEDEVASTKAAHEQTRANYVKSMQTANHDIEQLQAEVAKLTVERDAAQEQASECDRMLTLLRLNLERRLSEDLHYVPRSSSAGHPHGFSVIHIPDWEARQLIAEIQETLDAARKAGA